jgi:hypothetical protein
MGDFLGMGDSDKSSSSSSSATTTTTNNSFDRRQVVGEGAFGFASDTSNINVSNTVLDGGAIAALNNSINGTNAVLNSAMDALKAGDATNGQGFNGLLTLAGELFKSGGSILEKTAATTMAQVGALATAQNDAKGAIDQKTIMVAVGVAGAVAVAYAVSGGKK